MDRMAPGREFPDTAEAAWPENADCSKKNSRGRRNCAVVLGRDSAGMWCDRITVSSGSTPAVAI